MGNQQTISEAALNKISELEKEVLTLRQYLFEIAGTQLPKMTNLEFDYKYIMIYTQEKKQMKMLFKKYTLDAQERIKQIFLISYQYDVQHKCQYLEEYLAD